MIKIAYVVTPVEFGGSEKVNLTFLRNVDRNRFDICPILLTRPWENGNVFIEHLRQENYFFYKIPVAQKPRNEGRDYFRILRCIRNLYDILSKESFDLMHTHGYFADIIATPLSKILGIPHISTCHGFILNDRNLKVYNALDRFSLRLCNKVIAVSEGIRDDLIKSGISGSKIIVIQNAVQNSYDADSFMENRLNRRRLVGVEENEYVAGYVGRLSDEKGLRYLIEAGLLLKGQGEVFKILIIGDGPKRKELEDLSKGKGLERKIIFAGFQSDVENWLPAFDVFVLPSLTEGTPMALLEAMSAGIPVIATNVGGVPKIVENGVNGFLIDPGDFQALSEKIIILKENPVVRNKVVSEGINTTQKRFNVNEWCRKVESQYELLLRS